MFTMIMIDDVHDDDDIHDDIYDDDDGDEGYNDEIKKMKVGFCHGATSSKSKRSPGSKVEIACPAPLISQNTIQHNIKIQIQTQTQIQTQMQQWRLLVQRPSPQRTIQHSNKYKTNTKRKVRCPLKLNAHQTVM